MGLPECRSYTSKSHSERYFMVRRGLERCNGQTKLDPYLEHFLNAIGLHRAILVDVGAKDDIGISVFLALLSYVVAQLLEDRLRHVRVQVVYENSFRHFILNTIIFTALKLLY